MVYYLYHIPGKKIGVTSNPDIRITKQQGYKPGEYEILEVSGDIEHISERELTLQKQMGYKIDLNKYSQTIKNKNKKSMNINVTEQTTTFPCSVNELPARLMDNKDFMWETDHGTFELNMHTINWIISNVQTSQFSSERCFIYNKAFSIAISMDKLNENNKDATVFDNIRDWAGTRGIYEKGNAHTQYVKLQEEAGELAKALLQNDQPEVIDAIGDIVVVLTNLAHLKGLRIEDCISSAYNVISKRTGKMIDGTFVKDKL
jgi:NTP pyrophosphatase (non-canonical NTP hydrolase)